MARDLVEVTNGRLRLHMHPGQRRAWGSDRRIVAVLSGTQGGKTVFGPHWLYREIQRRGPGDYLVVTPTFQLLELKALPEFRRVFGDLLNLGAYTGSPTRQFVFSSLGEQRTFGAPQDTPTRVLFGYAADPESLESATVKAAWLDEAGQRKFKLGSWEAIRRRLSIHRGRVLLTTTPYDLGWLKQKIWDRWRANDPEIEVIRFDSTENPAFPQEEFEQARRDLPSWKFDLFYRAIFTRPAGLIYDAFNLDVHTVPRFAIPATWPRSLGLDFGAVNTAGIFLAEEPGTNRAYAYREYRAGGRTMAEHVAVLLRDEPGLPLAVGGSGSEDQWRAEARAAGLPVREPPITEVEIGIARVYARIKRGGLLIFDDLDGLLEEIQTYSRELDAAGEPTEAIEDKASYHMLDALRYAVAWRDHPRREQERSGSHSYTNLR